MQIKLSKALIDEVLANPPVTPTQEEERWVRDRIIRGRKARFTENVDVTRSLAVILIRLNRSNRRRRLANLRKHMQRLINGTFRLTHQGMAVNVNGELNDGQHRLLAVILTGITAPMQITWGALVEEKNAVDTGARRNAADMQDMAGRSHSFIRAPAAKSIYSLETGVKDVDAEDVNRYEQEVLGTEPAWEAAIRYAAGLQKLTSHTAVAVATYHIRKNSRRADRLDDFFENLDSGANLNGLKLKFREYLISHRGAPTHNFANGVVMQAGFIIETYNRYLRKQRSLPNMWASVTKLPAVL